MKKITENNRIEIEFIIDALVVGLEECVNNDEDWLFMS